MINPEQLAEWRALCDAASHAPWSDWRDEADCDTRIDSPSGAVVPFADIRKADVRLIVAARDAMPALIAELERLTAQIEVAGDLLLTAEQAYTPGWYAKRNAWIKENGQ